MLGLLSTTPKSSMRPPITAGPISRNSRFFSLSVTLDWPADPSGKVNTSARQNILGAKIILNVDNLDEVRRILSPLVIKAGHHTSPMPRRASIVSGMANRPVLRQTRYTPGIASRLFYTSPQPHARLSNCFHRTNVPRERSLSCPDYVRAPPLSLPRDVPVFPLLAGFARILRAA